MTISPETVAYWYLRLNGFLTVRHSGSSSRSGGFGAEGLLVGVRFPHRVARRDDPRFVALGNDPMPRPCFLVVEAHAGPCALTGYWSDRRGTAMTSLLGELGVLGGSSALLAGACDALRAAGQFSHSSALVSLAAVGREPSAELAARYPAVPQFLWGEVLPRLHAKISESDATAGREPWWDPEGLLLWRRALSLDAASFAGELVDRWALAA